MSNGRRIMAGTGPLRAGDPAFLGPYRMLGRLGEGGQGTVFLAADVGGRHVAVKLLHAEFAGDAAAGTRFVKEVAATRRVSGFGTCR
jgi:serine/threonine protein kinase